MEQRILFPFVKIVRQEPMKRALLLNIVDPSIGGVLIRGEKGTAKSTTVRSLNAILPAYEQVRGCPFRCNAHAEKELCEDCAGRFPIPKEDIAERNMEVVELPLNATEDRISGSLNIEEILASGKKKYEPGILAQANNNLLYIDEINLLDDHIVDLLLDSAAMGRNYVEREGISFSHPAKFILVGTMNPEEGSLRPQLLDRFGMCVDIVGETDPATRMAVIKQRLAFDADPAAYVKACEAETRELRERLVNARRTVKDVRISDELIHAVAIVAIKFKMEGHRADLAMIRAAKANAALEGRGEVTKDDILQTASLVLKHRLPAGPFEESAFRQEDLDRCLRGI